jgi:hypothetical protein
VPQEYIEVRGARESNLKNVSLRIPKRKITVFTGVSGSGKSSIVFDTIATESKRLLNGNFSTFVRTFLPHYAQPDADAIENLSMAFVVDQKHLDGGYDHRHLFRLTAAVLARRAAVRGLFQCLFVQRPERDVPELQWTGSQTGRGFGQVFGQIQILERRGDPISLQPMGLRIRARAPIGGTLRKSIQGRFDHGLDFLGRGSQQST